MNFIAKTFGGLSLQYYIRHFLFGCIFYGLILYMLFSKGFQAGDIMTVIIFTVMQFLYLYSRFVYESVVDYVLGDNLFMFPAPIYLFFKLMTMMLCWVFAVFIAPIGLAYLYYYHSKNS